MNEVKHKIEKELILLGYNPIHLGTHYLVESIYIVYVNQKEMLLNNIEKDVYFKIATKYNKNLATVKSNIIKATNFMNTISNNSKNELGNIYLTPKNVIWLINNKLKYEQ